MWSSLLELIERFLDWLPYLFIALIFAALAWELAILGLGPDPHFTQTTY